MGRTQSGTGQISAHSSTTTTAPTSTWRRYSCVLFHSFISAVSLSVSLSESDLMQWSVCKSLFYFPPSVSLCSSQLYLQLWADRRWGAFGLVLSVCRLRMRWISGLMSDWFSTCPSSALSSSAPPSSVAPPACHTGNCESLFGVVLNCSFTNIHTFVI